MYKTILILAAFEKGRGTGHLARSIRLARGLRVLGCDAWLYVLPEGAASVSASAAVLREGAAGELLIDREAACSRPWSCVIFDRFATRAGEFAAFAPEAPRIAIDEGGRLRARFDFVFDLLPNLPSQRRANVVCPALLPLPRARRAAFPAFAPEVSPRVLVSFGGEDAANLGSRAALCLRRCMPRAALTLVLGGAEAAPAAAAAREAGAAVVPYLADLPEQLAAYDLVVTHFGLTAFEALYARCAVVLLSPTTLHQRLSRAAGFFTAGVRGAGLLKLARYAKRGVLGSAAAAASAKAAARFGLEADAEMSLAQYIRDFDIRHFRRCPVCGENTGGRKILARFSEQTFFRCPRCSMIIQARLTPPPVEYAHAYFFDEYKKQYGKTYLEDFPNLCAAARRRLAVISKLLGDGCAGAAGEDGRPALLDVGCAYGAFLYAAREAGFDAHGLDCSPEAAAYVNETLRIPAAAREFPGGGPLPFAARRFDCVTLWFVIEHLQDVPAALEAVRHLLKPGGIFAFSTPSASGVSARARLKHFLAHSPPDHWSIWHPAACARLLKSRGFRVREMRITGHHPERFPLVGAAVGAAAARGGEGSLLYRALTLVSRVAGMGDTFEVYAECTVTPPARGIHP